MVCVSSVVLIGPNMAGNTGLCEYLWCTVQGQVIYVIYVVIAGDGQWIDFLPLLQGGAGRDGFGADALSEQHGSDLDVFGRKLAGIIMADYTQLALSAGPLDIAGQVRPEIPTCTTTLSCMLACSSPCLRRPHPWALIMMCRIPLHLYTCESSVNALLACVPTCQPTQPTCPLLGRTDSWQQIYMVSREFPCASCRSRSCPTLRLMWSATRRCLQSTRALLAR